MYVTDTHTIIWYLTNDIKLGKNAKEILDKAEKGQEIIIVPTIVLVEISYICERKGVSIKFKEILDKISKSINYIPHSLDLNVVFKINDLVKLHDIHDRIIVATAQLFNAKILTKDSKIKDTDYAEVVW